MRRSLFIALLVAATLVLWNGCGGGGGGTPPAGGFTQADAEGGWFGPMGTSTGGATPIGGTDTGKIDIDAGGNVTSFEINGAPVGVTGTFLLQDPIFGIFKLNLSDGRFGLFIVSPDRNHALYVDNLLRVGALQKGAAGLAGSYVLPDIQSTNWYGVTTMLNAGLDPVGRAPMVGAVSAAGEFQFSDNLGLTVNSPLGGPLSVVPATTNGQYAGPFQDNQAHVGNALFLITPDKQFMTSYTAWPPGPFPTDVRFTAWQKN